MVKRVGGCLWGAGPTALQLLERHTCSCPPLWWARGLPCHPVLVPVCCCCTVGVEWRHTTRGQNVQGLAACCCPRLCLPPLSHSATRNTLSYQHTRRKCTHLVPVHVQGPRPSCCCEQHIHAACGRAACSSGGEWRRSSRGAGPLSQRRALQHDVCIPQALNASTATHLSPHTSHTPHTHHTPLTSHTQAALGGCQLDHNTCPTHAPLTGFPHTLLTSDTTLFQKSTRSQFPHAHHAQHSCRALQERPGAAPLHCWLPACLPWHPLALQVQGCWAAWHPHHTPPPAAGPWHVPSHDFMMQQDAPVLAPGASQT
jgi:hypothetical protein